MCLLLDQAFNNSDFPAVARSVIAPTKINNEYCTMVIISYKYYQKIKDKTTENPMTDLLIIKRGSLDLVLGTE